MKERMSEEPENVVRIMSDVEVIGHLNQLCGEQRKTIDELEALVKQGELVVEDFLPNIGQCALQDFGRLNRFLNAAAKIKAPENKE